MGKKIKIFDTTLRDGEQSPGISFSVREKVEIATHLAKLGVNVIEAGFPITSEGDFNAVKKVAETVRGASVAALARVVSGDIDRAWEAVRGAENPMIHVFVSTSQVHMERKLRKSPAEVLKMIEFGVKRAAKYCPNVEFSPEDATRSDYDFLKLAIQAAITSGASCINVPDTVGYAIPSEFGDLISGLKRGIPSLGGGVDLSVHCHNDLGMAVANSIAAIQNGANQVECTINGLGERAGNAALEEVVMILKTRKDLAAETGVVTKEIASVSRRVSNISGYGIHATKPIVGANAFAHSSGIHTDGVLKERETYEIIDPGAVGVLKSSIVLGKTSGRHAFRKKVEELSFLLNEVEFEKAFIAFKKLADIKPNIDDTDLEVILNEQVLKHRDPINKSLM